MIEADTCPGCRGVLSETTAEDPWGRATLHRYKVPAPATCQSCLALAEAQAAKKDEKHSHALMWRVVED